MVVCLTHSFSKMIEEEEDEEKYIKEVRLNLSYNENEQAVVDSIAGCKPDIFHQLVKEFKDCNDKIESMKGNYKVRK